MSLPQPKTALKNLQEFYRHRVYKYLFTFIIVSVALGFQSALWNHIPPSPFLLFYPAVILAALYGDGTSAIIFSTVAVKYFFLPPTHTLALQWPQDYIGLSIFVISCFMVRKITRDQTKAKLEAEALVATLQSEQSAREGFVSALTHDLRTPLTTLKLNHQLLLRKLPDAEKIQALSHKNLNHIDRMEKMIRDLLDANQIKAGHQIRVEKDGCDLGHLLSSTVNDLQQIHGDRFILHAPESLPGIWSCDALKRVIENLCNNAVKYGSSDSPIVINCVEKKAQVEFSIHNQGKPIPVKDQATLFEPFRRSEAAHTSGKVGWGLGLSLVRGLVEAHDGEVILQSTEGGTIFTVVLPKVN